MSTHSPNGSVTTTFLHPGILAITFYHPKHNSLPLPILSQLTQAISTAGNDPQVDIILLQSAGNRTFCAGASFEELLAIQDEVHGKRFFMGFSALINAFRTCPKLIIGKVQGKAVGGGVGLAASMDYCMATQYAQIKMGELSLAVGPYVVEPAISRKVGRGCFHRLALAPNQFLSPHWAQEVGLFTEVFDTQEAMNIAAMQLATYLLGTSPAARQQLKAAFWEGCSHWDSLLAVRAAMSARLVLSEASQAALSKYRKGAVS